MEKQYNLSVIASDLKKAFTHDMTASTLQKCTSQCFQSLKENNLLPTEERCARNCFLKSAAFQEYFENQMRYTLRQE
eukprot:403332321